MIGRVHFVLDGEPLAAELSDDLAWSCPDPVVARWLALAYDPGRRLSPADGRPGVASLAEASAWLKGRVELEPQEPGERDVAY